MQKLFFKKHYCQVCSKPLKWYQKIVAEEKISRLTDKVGNITPYRHYEIRHYDCLTPLQKKELAYQKKQNKKKRKDDKSDTTNVNKIFSD